MRILVVRLSALGDLVHTLPVAAALRRALPGSNIDWLVDERFHELVSLVPALDRVVAWPSATPDGVIGFERVVAELRARSYDVALDVQGLVKSAVAARLSGARRVVGFEPTALREPAARWFHTEHASVDDSTHVVEKNLALVRHLGEETGDWQFPIGVEASPVVAEVRRRLGLTETDRVVVLNPGAAWESKCWAPARYGELARRLNTECGLPTVVSWGPAERARAADVVETSAAAAVMAPRTSLVDLLALLDEAALVVAGDTGPLHLAAAVGTPVVGIYGPTDPTRNGPWAPSDRVVSMLAGCQCRVTEERSRRGGVVVRRCRQQRRCLDDVTVEDVFTSVVQRLERAEAHAGS